MQDDGFHEIQLNGKQLVFLFMAATVVSALFFLFGVLVGRDVGAKQAMEALNGAAADPLAALQAQQLTAGGPDVPTTAPGDQAALQTPPDLSYPELLERKGSSPEDLKPGSKPSSRQAASERSVKPADAPTPKMPDVPAEPQADASQPAHAPAAAAPAETRAASVAETATPPRVPGEATRDGFTLQVAALRDRVEAHAMADRLTSKGYGAYVMSPAPGAPAVYRVRVGRYATRREAETVAAKLQREEQFKPWITR